MVKRNGHKKPICTGIIFWQNTMMKIEQTEDPYSSSDPSLPPATDHVKKLSLISSLRQLLGKTRENGHDRLREAIEEAIEQNASDFEDTDSNPGSEQERLLITNILRLRDLSALDVMIPRADIAALDINAGTDELMQLFASQQNTRIPIYDETLDNLIGTVHIKDYVTKLASKKPFTIRSLIRDVPIISPAMSALDLLLYFQKNGRHMAMVVDEYGGIDGLATIADVIEAIIGEIEDEYQNSKDPVINANADGTLTADARTDIEDFEKQFGTILNEEEREDIDTLAGLVFTMAGRVPGRGEILTHESGVEFEILDADPRRINRIIIRHVEQLENQDG